MLFVFTIDIIVFFFKYILLYIKLGFSFLFKFLSIFLVKFGSNSLHKFLLIFLSRVNLNFLYKFLPFFLLGVDSKFLYEFLLFFLNLKNYLLYFYLYLNIVFY